MAVERTLAIIKPDAVKRGLTGDILSRIHAAKFQIVAIKSRAAFAIRGRGILRRASRAAIFRRARGIHELGEIRPDGARSRRRHRQVARDHGRHRSRQGCARHHSQGAGHQHSIQLHTRFGRAANRSIRDQLFFCRQRIDLGDGANYQARKLHTGQRSGFVFHNFENAIQAHHLQKHLHALRQRIKNAFTAAALQSRKSPH